MHDTDTIDIMDKDTPSIHIESSSSKSSTASPHKQGEDHASPGDTLMSSTSISAKDNQDNTVTPPPNHTPSSHLHNTASSSISISSSSSTSDSHHHLFSASTTTSSSSISTIPSSIPSHKRGREPSSMTDPSEAARYTPPREMFKADEIDVVRMASLDDLVPSSSITSSMEASSSSLHVPEQESFSQSNSSASTTTDMDMPSLSSIPSDLDDNLSHQLSIHSPEKFVTGHTDSDTVDMDSSLEELGAAVVLAMPVTPSLDLNNENYTPSIDVPSPEEQNALFLDHSRRALKEGDTWYLLDKQWVAKFRKYCSSMTSKGTGQHPGSVDNTNLLGTNGSLRSDAQVSAQLISEPGWELLVKWYGTSTAPIKRSVVNTATELNPNLMVDFFPPSFTLYKVVDSTLASDPMFAMNVPNTLEVPRSTTLGNFKTVLHHEFGYAGPSRLWSFQADANINAEGNTITDEAIVNVGATCLEDKEDDLTLGEIQELGAGRDVAVEFAKEDGSYIVNYTPPVVQPYPSFGITALGPRGALFNNRSLSPSPSNSGAADGICGLQNLGNTCFMNSALQCLSNTPDLTRYILAGAWRDELNRDNPLGMSGEVARAYATLIDKLWNGTSKVFSPRDFKSTIGRFAPSFTGYHQHDSQELLAFLLDGLHEDLNRILKKPYTEVPDSNGRPDEEVAADCWDIHKARNDSIIVDLFQGQYKSTLVCPECEKVSVTFDPFMYLSLPLPINKKWIGTVTYVPYDPSKPVVDIKVQLPKGSTQRQLKDKVAEMMGTHGSHLFSAEVFSNRFYKSHDNGDAVDELGESDKTFLYELPIPDFTTSSTHVVFPVFSMLESAQSYSSYGRLGLIGHPMMVAVTKEEANNPDAVYAAVAHQASRYTTTSLYTSKEDEEDEEDEDKDDIKDDTPMSSELPSLEEIKVPKSGMFKLGFFAPPPPSRYRSMARATLYAPTQMPSWSDIQDIYQRVAPQERDSSPEPDEHMHDYDGLRAGHYRRTSSPSTNSSWNGGRARVPQPDEDDLSESEDAATLTVRSTLRRGRVLTEDDDEEAEEEEVTLSRKAVPVEPAVRQGDMIFCMWERSWKESISNDKYHYSVHGASSLDPSSGPRALWDDRAKEIVDPVLMEELANSKNGKKTITLEDCLMEYTKEEQLGEEDLWYCPNCKKHQQATKKLDIWRLPDILVVHLKRFSHTRAWRDKIDAFVDFPIHGLDLSGKALKEEDRNENVYDLYGVSNHMGGLGGGHYTAYAKNEKLDQWYNFDDSHVSPVRDVETIKSSSAYLLFYRRRNAAVREYVHRPATPVPPKSMASSSSSSSSGHKLGGLSSSVQDNWLSATSVKDNDNNGDEEHDGWGKPGMIGPAFGPLHLDNMDDDDELPSYDVSTGPMSLLSPTSMPSPLFKLSEDRGKAVVVGELASDDDDDDDLDGSRAKNHHYYGTNMSGYGGDDSDARQSPDLSSCASDGSTSATANASPDVLGPQRGGGYPVVVPVELSSMSSMISREGGRIDDEEEEEGGASAGILAPFELGEETEGEDDGDEVNLVTFQGPRA